MSVWTTDAHRRVPVVAAALGLALVLACCSDPAPTLLDESDVEGVEEATHDADEATTRGWTWCRSLDPYAYYRLTPTSLFQLAGGATVGATLIDRTKDGVGADEMLSLFEEEADLCMDGVEAREGDTIEPLSGLGADAVGWRTATAEGRQGELALIRLDSNRLLAVGVETDEAELPVELDELIRLAREGTERVGGDD